MKKVHALVLKNFPHVFECGVFREDTSRVGTFDKERVTCKRCRERLTEPTLEVEVPPVQRKPCPCESFFVEMTTRVRDICARCDCRR